LAVNLGVYYLRDFVFWFPVDDYRYWKRFGILQKDVRYSWFVRG